ncbi:MAG: hypothetical protein J7J72_02495 [Bacteroidales bacterium]|nr:hypothetical protein [Bacteroidales bacterium]
MRILKLINVLIGALILSLFRHKLNTSHLEVFLKKYNIAYPADWIGFILLIVFASVISIGVSIEDPLLLNNNLVLNIYILVLYIFFSVIIFSLLIRRFINPNISALIDRIPIHPFKTFILKLSIEAFDYKIIILISQIILIPVFNNYYGLPNKLGSLIIIDVIVINAYLFACQIALFVKEMAYSRIAKVSFNKIRLIIIIIAIPIYILSQNVEMKINPSASLVDFMLIMLGLNFVFFIFLRSIELSR